MQALVLDRGHTQLKLSLLQAPHPPPWPGGLAAVSKARCTRLPESLLALQTQLPALDAAAIPKTALITVSVDLSAPLLSAWRGAGGAVYRIDAAGLAASAYGPPGSAAAGWLGADRAANVWGFRACFEGPGIVIDAGTATTLECIAADGAFLGGVVIPGLAAAHAGLRAQAPALPDALDPPPATLNLLATAPAEAVKQGAWLGHVAMLEALCERFDAQGGSKVVVTGGFAAALTPLFSKAVQHVPDLTATGALAAFLGDSAVCVQDG